MIKLIIVDDHTIFREGLVALLEGERDIKVLGQANSGKEILDQLKKQTADVLLLDIEMPGMDGFDTIRALKKLEQVPKILVLTMHKSPQFIKNILKTGADGYLPKDAGKTKLVEAITTVFKTGSYHDAETAKLLMRHMGGKETHNEISPRELEIIRLIADQLTTTEIAEKLFISKHTVESHRQNILLKLGLKNSAGLVKYAIQKGLL